MRGFANRRFGEGAFRFAAAPSSVYRSRSVPALAASTPTGTGPPKWSTDGVSSASVIETPLKPMRRRNSPVAIFFCVLAIGIANAMGGPGMSAIMPSLVPREDLPGAVALASVQMNLSRVIGPPIAALIYHYWGASPVFAINALTYLAAVFSLLVANYPRRVDAVIIEFA